MSLFSSSCFFFFNDTATTEIYTLSLHDALPISLYASFLTASTALGDSLTLRAELYGWNALGQRRRYAEIARRIPRSEEHTSELQSQSNLVCRLLLEKKKTKNKKT